MCLCTSIRTSFGESADSYRQTLEASGFTVEEPRSRTAFALEFFNQMRAQASQGGPTAAAWSAHLDGSLDAQEGREHDRQS